MNYDELIKELEIDGKKVDEKYIAVFNGILEEKLKRYDVEKTFTIYPIPNAFEIEIKYGETYFTINDLSYKQMEEISDMLIGIGFKENIDEWDSEEEE